MSSNDPNWIEHAHLAKGALHRATNTPAGKDIPAGKEHKAEHSKSTPVRREADLAATLRNLPRK